MGRGDFTDATINMRIASIKPRNEKHDDWILGTRFDKGIGVAHFPKRQGMGLALKYRRLWGCGAADSQSRKIHFRAGNPLDAGTLWPRAHGDFGLESGSVVKSWLNRRKVESETSELRIFRMWWNDCRKF